MTKPKVLISDKTDPRAAAIFREREIEVDDIAGGLGVFVTIRIGLGVGAVANPKGAGVSDPVQGAGVSRRRNQPSKCLACQQKSCYSHHH